MSIRRLEALNYRSLRHLAQDVGDFHIVVGPNGAGKSTFLDVVAFVGDVLRAGPRAAIEGDAAVGIEPRSADPRDLTWLRRGGRVEFALEFEVPQSLSEGTRWDAARYELGIDLDDPQSGIAISHESLWLLPEDRPRRIPKPPTLFPEASQPPKSLFAQHHKRWTVVVRKTETGNDYFRAEGAKWNNQFRLGPDRSALGNLPADESKFPIALWVRELLFSGSQRVVLSAEEMRRSSPPGSPTGFLPDGSNLPWVVENLRRDDRRFSAWIRHLQTAIPNIVDIETIERPEDRHRYLVVRYANGLEAPSWVVSDGTLRLLALTLIAYLDRRGATYLIEEPENGVHPLAAETVVQALRGVSGSQVLCASHSPVVLSVAESEELLCFAVDDDGATDVVRGDLHPHLRQWKGSSDLGTLFASGVLGGRRGGPDA